MSQSLQLWLLLLQFGLWTGTWTLAALEAPAVYQPPELIHATLHVLNYHVCPRYNALAIMELSRTEEDDQKDPHHYHYDPKAMTYLLRQLGTRMALQLLQDTTIERPRDHILFLVDSAKAFRGLRFHFASTEFDKEFYFMILLNWRKDTQRNQLETMREIFETCLRFHVLNALILVQPEPGNVVLLYSYRLYAENCMDALTPELINRYEQGQLMEPHPLFGRSLKSLFGCPLNISWYPLAPFVMFNGDPHDAQQLQQSKRLTGLDGELLQVLADIFDFRINLLPPCEKRIKGMRTNTCFDQLENATAAVAIGAMSASHHQRERYSTTCSYHQSALVFVVPMERRMGAVNQLIQPFCGTVWLALLLSCLLALLLQWTWCSRRRIRSSSMRSSSCSNDLRSSCDFDLSAGALHVHTTLLGNPLESCALPKTFLLRCFLTSWLLLALVQRAAYQGKLYDVFRLPYFPPVPALIEDLVEGDYRFLASEFVDYFPEPSTLLRQFDYLQRFEELQASDTDERLTTSALLGNLIHYNQLNWKSSRLTHVREHIYLYQLVMYMPHRCILKFAFDRKLKQLQSSGIVSYINRYYEGSMFHAPYSHVSHEVTPIRLEMFCGLYFICYLMLIAALIVFLLELLSLRIVWLRRYFA